jgi:hypothetical protein
MSPTLDDLIGFGEEDEERECTHCHELYVTFHMCRDEQESEDIEGELWPCEVCGGDCSGANPQPANCPQRGI